MRYRAKVIRLKDGREATLRSPEIADASALLRYLKKTAADTPFLLRTPEECTMTLEEEERYLEKALSSEDKVMILCEIDGIIAGNCQIDRKNRKKTRHRAMLGLAIVKEFWGLGIGTEMFCEMIRLGREMGLCQLELEVIEGNERALGLYHKMGFFITGEKPDAICLSDGTMLKEYYMVKKL